MIGSSSMEPKERTCLYGVSDQGNLEDVDWKEGTDVTGQSSLNRSSRRRRFLLVSHLPGAGSGGRDFTGQDQVEIRRKLKSLGYIG